MVTMPWWRSLGLRLVHEDYESNGEEVRKRRAQEEVLTAFVPTSFEGQGRTIGIDELRTLIKEARDQVSEELKAEEQARRDLGWTKLHEVFEADDAEELVVGGVWDGFTRARARAWLWNLIQYEPFQFSPMWSSRRREREERVAAGEIVEVEHYAKRARQLERDGMTPHSYRRAQEALGTRTFSQGAVRSGPFRHRMH